MREKRQSLGRDSMSKLDKIKERLEAATAGPWTYDGMHNEICTPNDIGGYWLIVSECRSSPDQVARQNELGNYFDANFDLIAHMREDMALLVAVVATMLEDASPAQEAIAAQKSAAKLAETAPRSARRMIERANAWEAIA